MCVFILTKKYIKSEITVKNHKVSILRIENKEYISLTDLARYTDNEEPRLPIRDWMRSNLLLGTMKKHA